MLAPASGGDEIVEWLAEALTVGKAQDAELLQTLAHISGTVWPAPDKQANPASFWLAEGVPGHQAGDSAACADAAGVVLDVPIQAPIELALQGQVMGAG